MAELKNNPFTTEAFSNRLRYEAFSKLASAINSCKSTDEIGEALLRHLKYVLSFNAVKLWFINPDNSYNSLSISQLGLKSTGGHLDDLPERIALCIEKGIPQIFEGGSSGGVAKETFKLPLLQSKQSIALSSRTNQGKGFCIFLSKKEEIPYSTSDIKFAYLSGEFLLSKMDQILTNEALSTAHDQINEQHTDIIASLNYARRIQQGLFRKHQQLMAHIGNKAMVFFKPRDIVSGDFYYCVAHDGKVLIVAADCTGHGVPGAMLTVMALKFLDQIFFSEQISQPDEVLHRLNEHISEGLNTDNRQGVIRDGLDAAVVLQDLKTNKILFSGAKRPLWMVRNGSKELQSVRGSIHAVGKTYEDVDRTYGLSEFEMKPGDRIYLGTDGYADQFGGPRNKKFKTGNLKTLLMDIQDLPLNEQLPVLEKTFDNWTGSHPQTDDVLFMGFEF